MRRYSRISGTGSFLPPRRVTNDDLVAQLAERGIETSDQWIVERTGIHARHFAERDVCSSDLALEASRRAIEAAGVTADDIDLIIVATSTPDMVFPSTASILQNKLGSYGCAAFDVQAVCSGFVYALTVADAMIQSGMAKRALVVGSEVFSRLLDFNDRTTCVLFGDGAGAVVLEASETPGQANIRIMQSTARKLKLPMDKVIVTVDQHGNTSAASIPLALDHGVRTGQIKPGQNLLLEGVGGGFTWGAVLLTM